MGVKSLTWMVGQSEAEVRAALARVIPELKARTIVLNRKNGQTDPRWHSGSAVIEGHVMAKFAWSPLAADRVYREGQIMLRLRCYAPHLRLPEVVATSSDPVLVVTRLVPGSPLTRERIAALDRAGVDRAAAEISTFLAGLHDPEVLNAVRQAVVMVVPEPQADTESLRQRFGRWISAQQQDNVLDWCDWTDGVLGGQRPRDVLAHGDLHGHNQVWDMTVPVLRAVVDFETSGPIEPEFDLRYLPTQSAGSDLFVAVIRHYQRETGRNLDLERVMAWHIRTVLGDALWRSEANIGLPGGGTPSSWVDELGLRMAQLGVGPDVL